MMKIFILQLITIVVISSLPKDNYHEVVIQQIQTSVKDQNSELHHLSYNRLAYIVDAYGPRVWGSPSQALAVDDLYQQVKAMGFDNVVKEQLEPFQTWRRGKESLTLFDPRPFPQKLAMIGLGSSVAGNVTAYVVVVRTFDELDALGTAGVQGKIVCFNQNWTNYPEQVKYRTSGPSQAARYGAVGMLLRSLASVSINSPHTGQTTYNTSYKSIPAAAISVEDAQMFQRMQDRGQLIKVHLEMENVLYTSTSHNLQAEILGSQYPEEILLMGGHIDSWDTGSQTGSNDDGGGVMVCLEALHVLNILGLRPKRTIRFIAWSGEEMGLPGKGADQYAQQHASEVSKHVLAFESDHGTTKPYGFGFNGGPLATYNLFKVIRQIIIDLAAQYLLPVNASQIFPGDGDMVDTRPLGAAGIPVMRNEIKDTPSRDYYFQYHHSAGDTMDVMNPDDMDDNVIAIASMFFLVADLEQTLPRN